MLIAQRVRAIPLFVLINSKTEDGLGMGFLISADEEEQNRYITNDAEEIKILRDYIKTRVDNMFTEVKE